jgi:hypothetical protein
MKSIVLALIIGLMAGVGTALAAGPGGKIGNGCTAASTNPTAASTSSDSDCKWGPRQPLHMNCDAAVYIAGNGETATTSHDKIAVGDPYPLLTGYTDEPISVLAVAGTATCTFTKAR